MHAQNMTIYQKELRSFEPIDLTEIRTEHSQHDPRRVALNLAYLTRDRSLHERRELFAMLGFKTTDNFLAPQ
ncbi:hypothetical protein ACN08Y_10420 [Rothia sp. P5764]|uniref:hypothetical protein n=1 Tax=Rothia sp. P5764 TaxID=3402654 RepID=UPI003AC9143E